MAAPFFLGINYWPQRTFVRMWREFDAGQARRDFALLRSLHVSLVRCFLLWEDFQPAPYAVSRDALEKLDRLFDVAEETGVLLMPTIFVGHMSGPNWLPGWLFSEERYDGTRVFLRDGERSDRRPRSLFDDLEVVDACELLVRTVTARYRERAGLWGWDLCNEIDLVETPASPGLADLWVHRMAEAAHDGDPDHPVTAGFLHRETPDRGFQMDAHRHTDVVSVHAYPVYDPRAAGHSDVSYVVSRLEEAQRRLVRPAMLTEFGLPTTEGRTREVEVTWPVGPPTQTLVNEGEAADFVRAVVPAAREAGALGALLWCFADYDPWWHDRPPFDGLIHERSFGILAADGRLKATGAALREAGEALGLA